MLLHGINIGDDDTNTKDSKRCVPTSNWRLATPVLLMIGRGPAILPCLQRTGKGGSARDARMISVSLKQGIPG